MLEENHVSEERLICYSQLRYFKKHHVNYMQYSYKSVLIVEISIHQSVLIIQNHRRKMITQSGWVKVCAT